MPVLHNRISNDELKAKMLAESEPRTTISFYKYFTIASPQQVLTIRLLTPVMSAII